MKFNNRKIVTILLIVYAGIQSYCIQQLTVNYDEGVFSRYGISLLKLQVSKNVVEFDSQLPITALNMLPRAVEQVFHPGLKKQDNEIDIIRGRYVSLLATLILALLVYHWSGLLYGNKAAMGSLLIFLLCPNFLAHGIFVSSDIFACLFTACSLYFLWKFGNTGAVKQFLLASLFVGLAQISKFSMVHLIILFPILLLAMYFFQHDRFNGQKLSAARLVRLFLIFAGINWFVICAAHLFYGMFIPLNDYQFRSITFQHLQLFFHGAGRWLLIPLPSAYVQSLDMVIHLDHLGGGVPGSTIGAPYILGSNREHGFWYYYFVVLLYKLPLAVLLLMALTLILFFRNARWQSFLKNEIFLVLPAVYYLVYLSFFYSTQIGIRHIMMILPLLYIFIGLLFQHVNTVPEKFLVYGVLTYQLISVGLYFPHFLPYTNELVADKKMAYKKIGDTNLCYGEGRKFLLQYLRKNPDALYMPSSIVPGKVVVEINEMLDLDIATMGKFDWMRNLVPADHIHSQYLVFNINSATADSLRKTRF